MSNVVVGVDFSGLARHALNEALKIAASRPEARLHVVHVAKAMGAMVRLELEKEERSVTPKEAGGFLQEYVEAQLEGWAKGESRVDAARVKTHLRVGTPSTEIVQLAADLDADAIVVGTEGRTGVERFLLGSVAENVVHKAGCPVWVVREKIHEPQES